MIINDLTVFNDTFFLRLIQDVVLFLGEVMLVAPLDDLNDEENNNHEVEGGLSHWFDMMSEEF